ncbi:hypothetical protein A8924_6886 [Saccharopolyspora erythraea NRRL 2338]|uniref:Uncharacterized protein n=2 Tax=Saccharopolyspora erythraea TaxID=1836 RepID=A4FNS9_SACEN|nr:hypothetical protein [Saccharopolyspora erythraea]PFG99344.1 hypothetical protein A8924_6886 [Saccharopolyspora erythraea NRRL 2338]QRK89271.1 hypothetical protein JQX30_32720 [Saccharopolyspora erythraea]CAM05704.1 hypothetical protein SACE_6536 [Saccharopolyspora erythraea NRRL 2338]
MSRTAHALAVLVIGCLFVLAPSAVAADAGHAVPAGHAVLAQAPAPPPGPAQQPGQQGPQQLPERQRLAIGVTGAVILGLVFVSRKVRGKPVFFVQWKKK